MQTVRIARETDFDSFRDAYDAGKQPVLLEGLVAGWPAVRAAGTSPERLGAYLHGFDRGKPVETLLGPPHIGGRFFYNEAVDGVNFERGSIPIAATVARLLELRCEPAPPSLYVQSAPVREFLPGFAEENVLSFVHPAVEPRIWIGNRLTVQTHFDLSENIACVVAGRRRFTLFPPAETPNLYPGPFDRTLAGPPVSMVQLHQPDFARYPRFRTALEHALVADLGPGDALYIPYFWWHHVEMQDELNVLVNYWWNDAEPDLGSPFDALLHTLLAVRDLPAHQRDAWRMMFGLYAFGEYGDPVDHLPETVRGALGRHDAAERQRLRKLLLRSLARQAGLTPPGSRPDGGGS